MTLPDQNAHPEDKKTSSGQETPPAEVSYPRRTSLPEGFTPLERTSSSSAVIAARRRRNRRMLLPPGEHTGVLEDLARGAFPSADFFLFAIFSGILLGAGYLLDSDALLLLGLVLAPMLTPWAGMVLAAITGGWRFFLQTSVSLVIAGLLSFLASALVGLFNRVHEFSKFYRAFDHARLWWTDLLIVALGAVLLVLAFMRGERRPILPSILLAYGFFLPIGVAGFGLGAGLPQVWPEGLLILLTHLALATLAGGIVLAVLRFKPEKFSGYILACLVGLLCVAALVFFTGLAGWIMERATPPDIGSLSTSLNLASPTPALPPSSTPPAATQTPTRNPTAEPSATPTILPTPVFAIIAADEGGGVYVRTEPAGDTILVSLINGTLVEVLPEVEQVGVDQWRHIRMEDGQEGWMLQGALGVAEPWASFVTLTPTP